MKGALWITDTLMEQSNGRIVMDNEMLTWDMFFKERTRFLFQNYDVVKESVMMLTPSERRHNFDL